MVRFKNRYLLVELVPVPVEAVKPAAHPAKKARLTDLIAEKTKLPAEHPSINPLSHAALFQGLTSANAAAFIRQSLELNFGIYAAAENAQSLSVKYCNAQTGTLIVRSARACIQQVWAAITFLNSLPPEASRAAAAKDSTSYKFVWRVVHLAGTIRSAQKQAIKRSASAVSQALQTCTDEAQRGALEALAKQSESVLKAVEA